MMFDEECDASILFDSFYTVTDKIKWIMRSYLVHTIRPPIMLYTHIVKKKAFHIMLVRMLGLIDIHDIESWRNAFDTYVRDINSSCDKGRHSLLHLAVEKRRFDIVDMILARNDVNIMKKNIFGETMFDMFIEEGYFTQKEVTKIVSRYVSENIAINRRRIRCRDHYFAKNRFCDNKKGRCCNIMDYDDNPIICKNIYCNILNCMSPLQYKLTFQHDLTAIEILIEYGADIRIALYQMFIIEKITTNDLPDYKIWERVFRNICHEYRLRILNIYDNYIENNITKVIKNLLPQPIAEEITEQLYDKHILDIGDDVRRKLSRDDIISNRDTIINNVNIINNINNMNIDIKKYYY